MRVVGIVADADRVEPDRRGSGAPEPLIRAWSGRSLLVVILLLLVGLVASATAQAPDGARPEPPGGTRISGRATELWQPQQADRVGGQRQVLVDDRPDVDSHFASTGPLPLALRLTEARRRSVPPR